MSLLLVFKVKHVLIWNSRLMFHSSIYYLSTPYLPFFGCSGVWSNWWESRKWLLLASSPSVEFLLVDVARAVPLKEEGPSFTVLECRGSWQLPWFLPCTVASSTWQSVAFSAPWTSLTSTHQVVCSRVLPVPAFGSVWQPAASFSDFMLECFP